MEGTANDVESDHSSSELDDGDSDYKSQFSSDVSYAKYLLLFVVIISSIYSLVQRRVKILYTSLK